ncbi:hypothetical protein MAPG_01937 [Magnaporthiopsis poae ATCC 64411]|uniref:Zn(2)-C6 fungal-type domain-containing protein n=1 Tax=Magnaporthiopsis poae (strain ATCC 64411 / 73-15) TaxID=644358 RepID=A0A0C4DQ05_MAGP6|nr:hypothetical protein MAPG_01937 [Magnaporthiopsis poae ATCC 64411]
MLTSSFTRRLDVDVVGFADPDDSRLMTIGGSCNRIPPSWAIYLEHERFFAQPHLHYLLVDLADGGAKVRCHGGPPPCTNCQRLDFDCSFGDGGATTIPSASGSAAVEMRRGARACLECRSLKSRCTGKLPSCAACLRRGKTCTYPEPKRTPARQAEASTPAVSDTPTTTAAASIRHDAARSPTSDGGHHPLPPLRDRLHLVIDFFRHVHPLPSFAFLNEESVTQRCLEETIDEALVSAICAVSALLLGHSRYHPVATSAWAAAVETAVWANLEHPTIFKIQALLLAIQYRVLVGDFGRGFMLFSLASRSAAALRLMYERTDLSPLAQEIRRRLMWSLVMMDVGFATGLPECEVYPVETVYLRLPGPEEAFTADCDPDTDPTLLDPGLDGVAEGGLLATYVQLGKVRRDLMRLRRELQPITQPTPLLVPTIDGIVTSLDEILPRRCSAAELRRYAGSRWLARYLAVYLTWHQCHCDAYRLLLSGYKEAAPDTVVHGVPPTYVARSVASCLDHARAIIAIMHDANALSPRLRVAPPDMAICGYHAARLVLFISSSPQNPPDTGITEADALTQARSVLDIIKQQQKPGAAMDKVIIKVLGKIVHPAAAAADQAEHGRDSSGDCKLPNARFRLHDTRG